MAERRDDTGFDFDEGELGGAQTLPGAMPCPACKALSVGPFCAGCGFELLPSLAARGRWPALGARLEQGPQALTLKVALSTSHDAARWLALDEHGQRWDVFGTPLTSTNASNEPEDAEVGEALAPLCLPAGFTVNAGETQFTATPLPSTSSLSDALAALLADRSGADLVTPVERLILPVVRAVAGVHARGVALGGMDPAEVLVGQDGRVLFRARPLAFALRAGAQPAGRRRVVRGYAAPELLGHMGGGVDARTDVFSLGAALYVALTRVAPMVEAGLPGERLPPPQVYQPSVPPELAAVARRACSPLPGRRYAHAGEMLTALQVALDDTARRAHVRLQRLELDIGHELHIGVLKGQYSPVNQDDLFLAFDAASAIGLFMISDGVSISQHGTGDQASGCVRAEVANLWRQLCTPPSITEATTEDATALGTAHTLPGSDDRDRWGPRLPRSAEDRARLLAGALDAANHRIAERVHEDQPRFLGAAEGIMAATAVGALVEGNRALFFSIGDSRAYLVRNGHISSLMIDDDLTTQLMRLGRAPAVARAVASGGALIRCVGEFEKGENDRLVPVPLQPGFRELMLLPGDRIVVCSDGIPDYGGMDEEVAEDNIRRAIEDAPSAPWAAFELMVLANRGGGGDNISCIVLNFGPAHAGLADTDIHATVGGGA